MIHINLLPVKKIKQQVIARQQLMFFGIAFAVVLAILFFIYLTVNGTIGGLKSEIAVLENKKRELAEVLKKIEEIEKKKALVEKQTKIVEDLQKSSTLTVRVLDALANITFNERMWLTDIDQRGNTMRVTGIALDNQTIADFYEELENNTYVSNVVLTSATLQAYAGRNLQNFILSSTVKMPEQASEEIAETK